jgi:hypothetical protein
MKTKNRVVVAFVLIGFAGCRAVPTNSPVGVYPAVEWKAGGAVLPGIIGVQTRFDDGSNTIHDRRADKITQALVRQLQGAPSDASRQRFEVINSWENPPPGRFALVLRLQCTAPVHETRENKGLLLIAWPALVSGVAAPLGVPVLSCRGIIQEQVAFDWRVAICHGNNPEKPLREMAVPRVEAVVSATGWGTPRTTVERACEYADTHVIAAAIRFLNQHDMIALAQEAPQLPSSEPPAAVRIAPVKAQVKWNRANTYLLAVGVGGFSDPAIRKLEFPASDALRVGEFFRAAGVPAENITILSGPEATRNEILARLSKLRQQMDDQSLGIFYFSGHGAPLISYTSESEQGEVKDAALVPYDARDTVLADTGISLSALRTRLTETGKEWIVILDACFSGKAGRSIMPAGVKGMVVMPTEIPSIQKSGVCWLLATSGDNYANEHLVDQSGLFTHYLLQAMNAAPGADADRDGELTMHEVYDWTSEQVVKWSRSQGLYQKPEMDAPQDRIDRTLLKCVSP